MGPICESGVYLFLQQRSQAYVKSDNLTMSPCSPKTPLSHF